MIHGLLGTILALSVLVVILVGIIVHLWIKCGVAYNDGEVINTLKDNYYESWKNEEERRAKAEERLAIAEKYHETCAHDSISKGNLIYQMSQLMTAATLRTLEHTPENEDHDWMYCRTCGGLRQPFIDQNSKPCCGSCLGSNIIYWSNNRITN